MTDLDKKIQVEITTGTIFKIIVVFAVIGFAYMIRDIVAIVFFSILLILILQPPVTWLNKFKIPKSLGVLIIYLLLFAFFALAVILIIPPISAQITQLISAFGLYWTEIANFFGIEGVENDLGNWQNTFGQISSYLPSATQDIFSRLTGVISAVVTLFIVLVITFYGLVEESAFKRVVRTVVPSVYQPYLYRVANRIQRKLGMWVRGQLLLALAVFVLTYIGLLLLGVPYALVLALITGLLEFIPYVGPIVAGVLAVFLTVFEAPLQGLLVAILYLVIQQVENHLLVPKIMQRTTGLNPVVSIVALLIGANLGGVIGMLLAIPVALTISVFISDFVNSRATDQLTLEE